MVISRPVPRLRMKMVDTSLPHTPQSEKGVDSIEDESGSGDEDDSRSIFG